MTFYVGGDEREGRTKNVSHGGLCADLAEPIAPGTDVELSIALVFSEEVRSEALRLPSRVAWCTSVDEGYQVGVAFRPLDAESSEYLTVLLRYLDDHRTERDPRELSVDDRFR